MNYFNYFSEIEAAFVSRRGRNLLLSPLDWALIESWRDRQIPLRIVLRAIDTVFDRLEGDPRPARNVRSLAFCRDAVEAAFADWQDSQVGRDVAASAGPDGDAGDGRADRPRRSAEDPAEEHLRSGRARLERAIAGADGQLAEFLRGVERRLDEVAGESRDPAAMAAEFEEIDGSVDQFLVESMVTEDAVSVVRRQSSGFREKMEPDVFERTCRFMLAKLLRERHGIPRFSFFDL